MQLIYPDKDSGKYPAARPRYVRALKKFKCLPVKAKAGAHASSRYGPVTLRTFKRRHRVGQDTTARAAGRGGSG